MTIHGVYEDGGITGKGTDAPGERGIGVQTGQTHAVQGCIAPVFPAGGGVYMADDSRFRVNVIDAPGRPSIP